MLKYLEKLVEILNGLQPYHYNIYAAGLEYGLSNNTNRNGIGDLDSMEHILLHKIRTARKIKQLEEELN